MNSRWAFACRKAVWRAVVLGLALSTGLVAGCGGKGAKVTGKVTTADGKPVTGGSLTFAPIPSGNDRTPGKPASADVQSDGSFTVDEVVVGKCKVTYTAPSPQYPPNYTPKASEPAPVSPFTGMVPVQSEVDVPAGGATLEIKISYPGAK